MKDVRVVFLKKRIEAINKKIAELDLKALIFSDRDREVTKQCDAEIASLNVRYLDLDDELQTLERKVS